MHPLFLTKTVFQVFKTAAKFKDTQIFPVLHLEEVDSEKQ